MSHGSVEMRWHPYTTRARHVAYGDPTLCGFRVYEIGTLCLAARLHNYQVVLTFDDLSLILGEEWYIAGVEDPLSVQPKWVRDIHAIEDACFIEALNKAIERNDQERDPSLPP